MTYLSFLSLFLLPVLIVVSCIFFKTYSKNKFRLKGIIILVLIAVIYTTHGILLSLKMEFGITMKIKF